MTWHRTGVKAVTIALTLFSAAPGFAQDLTYEPVNPSFGGDSLNSKHLRALADKQNQTDDESGPTFERQSPQEQFAESLERQLLARTANEIVDQIYGGDNTDPQDQGTFVVGQQKIEFQRSGETVDVTLTDLATGAETDLSIPVTSTTSN